MGSDFSDAQGRAVMAVDYYAILSRAIEAAKDDPGKTRRAIYNMARISLDREAVAGRMPMTGAEYKTHRAALEHAVQKIEAEYRCPFPVVLSPRVDFAIQVVCAIFLVIAILAVATGYIEIHAAKHVVP